MSSMRMLVSEVSSKLDPLYEDESLPDGAWFQRLVDTVEEHFKNRRRQPCFNSVVMAYLQSKQRTSK